MSNDTHDTLTKPLWVPRPVEETLEIYADWAETYDADVIGAGYATPARIAKALTGFLPNDAMILDFGCGTGLSGLALKSAGFTAVDGTDISAEMLEIATTQNLYRKTWQSQPGGLGDAAKGDYVAIVAAGVISLGAAPPETLHVLLDGLNEGGLIGLSFNDPTLQEGSYDAALDLAVKNGLCEIIFREHGPHLPGKDMGSDVMVLKRL